jgi:hypothetical protein
MSFELSKGDLFVTIGDTTTELGKSIPYTEEIELSAKEHLSHLYHLNAMSSMSLQTDSINLELLHNVFNMPPANGKFTMEYRIPIMTQARWHKKSRINKKWFKRFGMKPDTIKCRANATVGEYHTDDGSFDFESDAPEFLWRPDQLRKDLKIEF